MGQMAQMATEYWPDQNGKCSTKENNGKCGRYQEYA
jgi:hypothetical protein